MDSEGRKVIVVDNGTGVSHILFGAITVLMIYLIRSMHLSEINFNCSSSSVAMLVQISRPISSLP